MHTSVLKKSNFDQVSFYMKSTSKIMYMYPAIYSYTIERCSEIQNIIIAHCFAGMNAGCCWAFSTVAAVEGITMIKKGQLLNLSEQQLVDCDRKFNKGCQGGSMVSAFDYIHHHGGLAGRCQYPYKGFNNGGSCNNNIASQVLAKLSGFGVVPPNNEKELLKAVAHQPVSVAVDSTCDAFRFYSSGILTQHCGTKLDHAVTIIGYGEENGMKYWLAKNSWGTKWGENGFIRMRRESGVPAGMCGLTLDASYPVV